jgi:hypothetical protein
MGKPKRRKMTRVKDLAAKKARDVRGGKTAGDESLDDGKQKGSGGFLGGGIGTVSR